MLSVIYYLRHRTKFREDRSNRSRDMSDFRFFKMAAIRHLGLVLRVLDHPRRVLSSLCDCAKFDGNRCSNFNSMQILIFCRLSLKMPIYAPKLGVFGAFGPQNGEQYERDPKRHILRRKHVVWRINCQNRATYARSA